MDNMVADQLKKRWKKAATKQYGMDILFLLWVIGTMVLRIQAGQP